MQQNDFQREVAKCFDKMNVKSSVIQGESFETTQKRKKDHMKETHNELA